MDRIDNDDPTQNALTQCFDDFPSFNQGLNRQAVGRTAIVFGYYQILGNVNEAAGEIARVGRLQRSIGKTFTRAVGRNEILQYIQTFAKVRGDRRLDDRAIRLGHQTTHTRQLTNLRSGAARTRVSHHVNGVEGLLRRYLAITSSNWLGTQLFHHRFGYLIASTAPNIDDLVVALTLRNQA